jgi:hypothetical protein
MHACSNGRTHLVELILKEYRSTTPCLGILRQTVHKVHNILVSSLGENEVEGFVRQLEVICGTERMPALQKLMN